MDERIKQYLEQKYGPDYEAKTQQDYEDSANRINAASAFANLGDVFARKQVGSLNPYFERQRGLAEASTLGKLEKERADAAAEVKSKDYLEMQKELLRQRLTETAAQKDLDRKLRQDLAAQAKVDKADDRREKAEIKKGIVDEKAVQGLSKAVEGTQSALSAIDNIETALGAPLEAFSSQDGALKRAGKDVDLPGISVPGLGRVSAYSGEARDLASKAATVFNSVLKDRSGAAVTNTELERLKGEFGQGKYNTEAELIGALKQYKIGLAKELKNREAGYPREAVQQYGERGGRTSMSLPQVDQSQAPDQEEMKSLERQKRIQELRAKVGGK